MAKIPSALDNMKPVPFSSPKPKAKKKTGKALPSKKPALSVMLAMGKGGKGGM